MDTYKIEAQMLIRKSPKAVFNAFVDPKITTQFWFTKSSGKVEKGKTLIWAFEMYGVEGEVTVLDVQDGKKITIIWGNPQCKVDFHFEEWKRNQTLVKITCYDFEHKEKDLIPAMLDYMGGFTTLLDGAKAYLEHGIQLNLTTDKYPEKIK